MTYHPTREAEPVAGAPVEFRPPDTIPGPPPSAVERDALVRDLAELVARWRDETWHRAGAYRSALSRCARDLEALIGGAT